VPGPLGRGRDPPGIAVVGRHPSSPPPAAGQIGHHRITRMVRRPGVAIVGGWTLSAVNWTHSPTGDQVGITMVRGIVPSLLSLLGQAAGE